ncbi:dihydroneopterin triphosphate diphosphatase [Pantoea allii]|uniref:Dihydroneopterin triphosphate diphosphatase n=1 Tax=Pantoea allii TaxID=574096 RepID=A0A2V2BN45_9GAMM|nr:MULTISPECIES: dihydroneopterin triphosphate diphosphatase [Pantoea]MBW1212606.1 dihydroneopterin triphosphate diphosphatase [Pantoea allii]MBW1254398.1 dihydroneopterin triphosphate diphosphatase [Pantoea allii]MBW1255756.1 dihydroneopterin triphosphate diphosphatase [Pantoea allii]MBW1263625.1 dihydroneopterin triphosphate diphosphatase [Pantoea allii]MBW1264833.1 dihydroneopterin triphosphate diphosphatase [Pantoea allii]
MPYKHPVSVLVVIVAQDSGRVLMLQRRDDPDFWQSVTGSLEADEVPLQAAEREVGEELGIDVQAEQLTIEDCQREIDFEIFPHYRHRYAPGTTHNREHWFRLTLPTERDLLLTEHLAACWLEPAAAAALTKSWSNRQAIEEFI